MTNPTPHGQVPEALIDLIDAYAETRHRCGGIYNARTEAARKAVIEALSGVRALSAGPAAKKSALRTYPNPIVPLIKPVSEQEKMRALYLASSNLMAYLGRNGAIHSDGHAADAMMDCLNDLDGGGFDETLFAASPTPPALSAAPVVPRMSAAEVNTLPAHVRSYIHQLASLCDPAGLVRENVQLLDTNNALQKMYRRAADACAEVFGCFAAAESEGLKGALSDATDERLKDLVERRLMYAMHAVRDIAASPTPPAEQQAQPGAVGRTGCTAGADEECTRRGCATSCPAQQVAPKAAPEVGNSGFDHKTAADFLNGKTVSDEAVRKFVAASRWAHDERAALSATLLAMHGVLTSREAEIAHLKKALLEAQLEASGFTAADMATAEARGFRDGVASVAANAGSEPIAWLVCTEEGDPSMVFLDQREAQMFLEDDERPTPLYTHPPPTSAEGVEHG